VVKPAPPFWLTAFHTWANGTAATNHTHRLKRASDGHWVVPHDRFYGWYAEWLEDDSITVATVGAETFNLTGCARGSARAKCRPADAGSRLSYARMPFYVSNLKETVDFTAMINEVRAVCEKYAGPPFNIPNFPSGPPFTFWEQYINIWSNLAQNVGISLAIVFCCSALFLLDAVRALI
jgi:patched 1 protein